jgi:xanthine phosphoribosyltransferase
MDRIKIAQLTWDEFGAIVLQMAEEIQADYGLDAIVGIGKSGIIPAAILAKRLGVPEFHSIVVSLYNEGKPPLKMYRTPRIKFNSVRSLEGKKVLVVDDFIHTGATLETVIEKVSQAGADEVRTAVVGLKLDTSNPPDFIGTTFNGCLRFPWDTTTKHHE